MVRAAAFVILVAVCAANVTAQEAPGPFTVGQTSYEQADAAWADQGAVVARRGHLGVGAGSGVDGLGRYAVNEVQLVDVSGADFEGMKVVRYAFVDGTLFSITARLNSIFAEDKAGSNGLSEPELKEFEQKLRAKYGPPTRSLRDMFAGKKPNVFVWDFRDRELILHLLSGIRSSLQLRSKALSKKADQYARIECRKHRPQCAM